MTARRLYTLLLWLALPFALPWLWWRAGREPGGQRGFGARLGFGAAPAAPGGLWLHAASVGEVQAAAALFDALAREFPEAPLLLTCGTPAGRARARTLFGARAMVEYAPLDLPGAVRRALRRLQPALLVVLEAEIWPNLLAACAARGVPVVYASARLSERSARLWARGPGLLSPALARGVWVAAQSAADAARYARIGVPAGRIRVAGNLKFDRALPPDVRERGARLRARYAPGRPLWVAGSTRAGEEESVLLAARVVAAHVPGTVLALAPRHPPRFAEVAALLGRLGCGVVRRSDGAATAGQPEVVLVDTLGELLDFYAAADVAFVGGSLVAAGGHNLLEPAALGVPVVAGPHQFSAPDIAAALRAAGALTIVADADGLAAAVMALLADPAARARQGAAARAVVEANRGALERILELLRSVLH